MICPEDHQQDKNFTANNTGLSPRDMVQGHVGLERNEATKMATVFPCQNISMYHLYLSLQKVIPSGSMISHIKFSPCDLPPPPILHHKNYILFKKG